MSRVIIDLRDTQGRLDVLEVTIHRELVECWLSDRCRGVFDRTDLRDWLDTPIGTLSRDEISLIQVDSGDITVSIEGAVASWPLAHHVLVDLRSRL